MTARRPAGRSAGGLWSYFALTYAISWLCWGSMIVFGLPGGSVHPAAPPPPAGNLLLLAWGRARRLSRGALMTWREGAGRDCCCCGGAARSFAWVGGPTSSSSWCH